MATCPLCVLALVTAQSEQDLSEPFPWAARREGRGYLCDFIVLFCFFVFFSCFLGTKSADGAKSLSPGERARCLAQGCESILNENKTTIF